MQPLLECHRIVIPICVSLDVLGYGGATGKLRASQFLGLRLLRWV